MGTQGIHPGKQAAALAAFCSKTRKDALGRDGAPRCLTTASSTRVRSPAEQSQSQSSAGGGGEGEVGWPIHSARPWEGEG